MGENSDIEWTHHTFNPWWGCHKVSPGCKNCYAEALDHRLGNDEHWGLHAPRKFFGDKHWNNPLRWDRAAAQAGERHRVFCASVADVFEDRPDLVEHRERLWKLIAQTTHLDWLLLTKRPENFGKMLPWGDAPWANVWLGASAENQEYADLRLPILRATPAAIRFVSYEPALEAVNFAPLLTDIAWLIAGSESGPGARAGDMAWYADVQKQCETYGVKFFLKQHVEGTKKISLPMIDGKTYEEVPT